MPPQPRRGVTIRAPFFLLPCITIIAAICLTVIVIYRVDYVASQTRTVVGHNLDPTPWHDFTPKNLTDKSSKSRTYKIMKCSYLSCPYGSVAMSIPKKPLWDPNSSIKCPELFKWIYHDLQPWQKTGITKEHVNEAKKHASFRVVIVGGKMFVDLYYMCVESRMMFTIWGFLQLLNRYPEMVPDVDLMFDCMDKPTINRTQHAAFPLPLLRYCTTPEFFDIPFPDWSFWGWIETNIRPWDMEFPDIKEGSQVLSWPKREAYAYWKGNPDVASPIRTELLRCNNTKKWGAQIMRQNWTEERKAGFRPQSRLSNQCHHRYKIYAEGYAWSVSLKYILSCGSLVLLITPKYEDFFSRGLIPLHNYWPVDAANLCPSIKYAVDWGNKNPSQARTIGRNGQNFMGSLTMDQIYDYMLHLIVEYSKLQNFKPNRPSTAQEVCAESILCFADKKQKEFLKKSVSPPSSVPQCTLDHVDNDYFEQLKEQKRKTIRDIEDSRRMQVQGP